MGFCYPYADTKESILSDYKRFLFTFLNIFTVNA